jgi:hypothetical protein
MACNGVDIPEGPDLAPLWNSYEDPQGQLSDDDVKLIMTAAQVAFAQIEALGRLSITTDKIQPTIEQLKGTTTPEVKAGAKLRLTGFSDVTQICPGLEKKPTKDADNGSAYFTLTIQENLLQPVLWGTFDNCEMYNLGNAGTLDGTWGLTLGKAMSLEDFEITTWLMTLQGTWQTDQLSNPVKLDLDFRVSDQKEVQIRIPAEGGDVIFSFGETLNQAGLQTVTDSFCCYFDDQECFSADSGTCEGSHGGGTRINW